jgi:acetate CoA/acetoacetate CoA-transferase beta subunit
MSTNGNDLKERIAKRIAKEFKDQNYVNLGIGLPTKVANYIPEGIEVFFESENGMICMGSSPSQGEETFDVVDAGGQYASALARGAYFDSSMSFGMIRGGHIDICVLGALEVDEKGNLASWIVPGKIVPGMGGAMDLVTGVKRVIISTLHSNRGKAKILKECSLPLTAVGKVDTIVTELAVMKVTDQGLRLLEIHESVSLEELQALTEAQLIVDENLAIWRD